MASLTALLAQFIRSLPPKTSHGTAVLGVLEMNLPGGLPAGKGILVPLRDSVAFFNGKNRRDFEHRHGLTVTQEPQTRSRAKLVISTTLCAACFVDVHVSGENVTNFCLEVTGRTIS